MESIDTVSTEYQWAQELLKVKMVRYALGYAHKGWAVVPLHWVKHPDTWHPDTGEIIDAVCSCYKGSDCESTGKHPMPRDGLKSGTKDFELIKKYWRKYPYANIGILTGEISNLAVLDIDGDAGRKSCALIKKKFGKQIPTVSAITGSNGQHLLWLHPGKGKVVRNRTKIIPGIDFRGDGGYIVAPPSMHEMKRRYRWVKNAGPGDIKIAPMPSWFWKLDELNPDRKRKPRRQQNYDDSRNENPNLDGLVARVGSIPDGQRNDRLFRIAAGICNYDVSFGQLEDAIHEVNKRCCSPPLSDREVDNLIKATYRRYG